MGSIVKEGHELSGITMIVDNDRSLGREQRVEAGFVESVRMISDGSENQKIDHVDDPYSKIRAEILPENRSGGDNYSSAEVESGPGLRQSVRSKYKPTFMSEFKSNSNQYNIGVNSMINTVVLPNTRSGYTMFLRFVHC